MKSISLSFPSFQWVWIAPVLQNVASKLIHSKSSKEKWLTSSSSSSSQKIIINKHWSCHVGLQAILYDFIIPGLIVLHTQGFVKAIWFRTTTRNQVEWPEQRLDRITKDFREAWSDFLSQISILQIWVFRVYVAGEPVAFTNLPELTWHQAFKFISSNDKLSQPCCFWSFLKSASHPLENIMHWNQHLMWPRYSYSHWWNHLVWIQLKRWDVLLPGWRRWNRYPANLQFAPRVMVMRCHDQSNECCTNFDCYFLLNWSYS